MFRVAHFLLERGRNLNGAFRKSRKFKSTTTKPVIADDRIGDFQRELSGLRS